MSENGTDPVINSTQPLPTIQQEQETYAEIGFEDLALSEELRAGIRDRGYTRPTPVQAKAIPVALSGKDMIVRSKTGTGKTAAFGIPLLERLPAGARHPLAIVLCPTRELAIQVAEEITVLASHKDLRVVAIYGGAPMKAQTDALENGAEIIVGTPGRVYDHIRRKNLDLSKAQAAVLDEADEMLNQGFYEEVTRILERLPEGRQLLLFSATVPPDIDRLIKRFCKDPETLLLSGDDFTVENIENVLYYTVDSYPKPRSLIYLLELEEPESAIVFCNTRDDTSLVCAVLNRNGFDAEVLNGDLPQSERERVMGKIKRGEMTYLVATDIAARGIDISDLSHVINYSLPEDPAVYLHRVGRTGRIGKKGVALSLIGGKEMVTLTALEKRYGIHFEERKLPTPEEARKRWADRHLAEIKDASRSAVYEAMIPLAQDLKAMPEGDATVGFLLRYFFTHHRIEKMAAKAEAEVRHSHHDAERDHDRGERSDRGDRGDRGGRRDDRERRKDRERTDRNKPAPAARERTNVDAQPAALAEKTEIQAMPQLPPEPDPRGTKLWCNLGQADKLDEGSVVEAISQASGVDGSKIRAVELRPTSAYVFVEPELVESVLSANGKERDGKKLRLEKARITKR
ncbi:MAG TPA: DEAD/DEAH box helicase [Myxococcales bacterium]|jgi:ATP-dependent RNA helicase DeaD